jgi:hypothetical protein
MKEWIIFLVGALGGSLVGSGAAIYTYHHKLRDERRNRDRDKKQLAYEQYATYIGLYLNELLLIAEVGPIAARLDSGDGDDVDRGELRRVNQRVDASLGNLHEPIDRALNQIALLAPKHVHETALDVHEVCWKILAYMQQDQYEKAETLEWDFAKRLDAFRAVARADLGIRE